METTEQRLERVIKKLHEEKQKQIADFHQARKAAQEKAAKERGEIEALMQDMGLKLDKVMEIHKKLEEETALKMKAMRAKDYSKPSVPKRIRQETLRRLSLHQASLPPGSFSLFPAYLAYFSTHDESDPMTAGTGTDIFSYWIWDYAGMAYGSGAGWFPPADTFRFECTVTSLYDFTPDVSSIYVITPWVLMEGFFTLRAQNTFPFYNKHAYADVEVELKVAQDDGAHQHINRDIWVDMVRNDNKNSYLSKEFREGCTAYLRSGRHVTIIIDVIFSVGACGGGSYAELNFSDGEDNYIISNPLSVIPQAGP